MANPYFLGVDLSIPTYTWSAGADPTLPVTNLQDYFTADVSASNANTINQTFNIDFGSAVACNTVVVDGQNFVAVGADLIVLQYNTNDDTDWTDAITSVIILQASNAVQVRTFTSATKRYWRLLFSKASGTLSANPSMGLFYLGTRLVFESTYEWNFAKANKQYETSETVSLNGDIRMSQSVNGRKMWDLLFRLQSDTFRTNWDTFMDTIRGKLRPFYFIDVDGTTISHVHLDTDYTEVKQIRYNQNDVSIRLKNQTTYL